MANFGEIDFFILVLAIVFLCWSLSGHDGIGLLLPIMVSTRKHGNKHANNTQASKPATQETSNRTAERRKEQATEGTSDRGTKGSSKQQAGQDLQTPAASRQANKQQASHDE
jgi:hypothetical protein